MVETYIFTIQGSGTTRLILESLRRDWANCLLYTTCLWLEQWAGTSSPTLLAIKLNPTQLTVVEGYQCERLAGWGNWPELEVRLASCLQITLAPPPPSAEAPEKCKVEHTKTLSGDWIDACQGVEGNKKGIYKSIREKGTLPSKESKL